MPGELGKVPVMGGKQEEVLDVLREVWSAQGQSAEDVEEACGTTKSCKRMTDVGFDGLAEETDGDLRAAWRDRLAREGKLNPGAGSVRDLVL
ncbi:MAG: hypothetical protein ACRDPY_35305 [Streptosporangiaceae bacterium]